MKTRLVRDKEKHKVINKQMCFVVRSHFLDSHHATMVYSLRELSICRTGSYLNKLEMEQDNDHKHLPL